MAESSTDIRIRIRYLFILMNLNTNLVYKYLTDNILNTDMNKNLTIEHRYIHICFKIRSVDGPMCKGIPSSIIVNVSHFIF